MKTRYYVCCLGYDENNCITDFDSCWISVEHTIDDYIDNLSINEEDI